jgi:hypothetical protein
MGRLPAANLIMDNHAKSTPALPIRRTEARKNLEEALRAPSMTHTLCAGR